MLHTVDLFDKFVVLSIRDFVHSRYCPMSIWKFANWGFGAFGIHLNSGFCFFSGWCFPFWILPDQGLSNSEFCSLQDLFSLIFFGSKILSNSVVCSLGGISPISRYYPFGSFSHSGSYPRDFVSSKFCPFRTLCISQFCCLGFRPKTVSLYNSVLNVFTLH